MPGLADAYNDDVGALQSRTRLQAGLGLLALGTLLGLLALVVALLNPNEWGARRVAGALGGLAAPALASGVVVILPANARLRAASAIGASLTILGVAIFWQAYPHDWLGHGDQLTPYVALIYFMGMLTIAGCLFAGIATLKRRNDPGGTVSLMVGEGQTRIVEVESDGGSTPLGGVGFLGSTPDGEVETQTNRSESVGDSPNVSKTTGSTVNTRGRSGGGTSGGFGSSRSGTDGFGSSGGGADGVGSSGSGSGRSGGSSTGSYGSGSSASSGSRSAGSGGEILGGSGTVSDGGSTTETVRSPDPQPAGGTSPDLADEYCGNCEHFSYVRTDSGMTPHCAYHGEYMDDMEACADWAPNAGDK